MRLISCLARHSMRREGQLRQLAIRAHRGRGACAPPDVNCPFGYAPRGSIGNIGCDSVMPLIPWTRRIWPIGCNPGTGSEQLFKSDPATLPGRRCRSGLCGQDLGGFGHAVASGLRARRVIVGYGRGRQARHRLQLDQFATPQINGPAPPPPPRSVVLLPLCCPASRWVELARRFIAFDRTSG